VTGRAWRSPVYDVHPADQAVREVGEHGRGTEAYSAMELDRDLMVKEGWPCGAAEQMALRHARGRHLTRSRRTSRRAERETR